MLQVPGNFDVSTFYKTRFTKYYHKRRKTSKNSEKKINNGHQGPLFYEDIEKNKTVESSTKLKPSLTILNHPSTTRPHRKVLKRPSIFDLLFKIYPREIMSKINKTVFTVF